MTDAAGGGQLPPELAERVARRRASSAAPPTQPQSPPPAANPSARAPQRKQAGKGSRLAMAGGAIGLSFGLVGAMAAAASASSGGAVSEPVIQRVVVPQAPVAAQPAQVIVMLPSSATAPGSPITVIEVPSVDGAVTIPDIPASPAPVTKASAPVAESHGS